MNDNQKKFHDFYMDMVIDEKKDEAEKLLMEGFKKQDEGKFDSAYFKEASSKYYDYVKLESKAALKKAMDKFSEMMD